MSSTARIIRLLGIAAVLCFVALAVISKVWIEPAGLVIFDSRLTGYTPDDARVFLAALNTDQKAVYLGLFRVLDTVFPILLAIALVGTIWLNTGGEKRLMRVMALLGPVLYLVFDLLENALVGRIITGGPEGVDAIVLDASTYTQAKWMCLALSLLVVFWAWRFAAKGQDV